MYTGGTDWLGVAQWLGGGAGCLALVQLLKVVLPFIERMFAQRQDRLAARQKSLDAQQARLDARYDARLRHLELAEVRREERISDLEEAVNILTTALREIDPRNGALSDVARILRKAIRPDVHTPQEMIDKLKGLE